MRYLLGEGGASLGTLSGTEVESWNLALPSGEVVGRLGSVRTVVGADGGVEETRDYYPFGLRMPGRHKQGAARPAEEDFTGHHRDGASQLLYAGARYYMPALGRWTTTEPLLSGSPAGLVEEGQLRYLSATPYNYVFNNPTGAVDPTGMAAVDCPPCPPMMTWEQAGANFEANVQASQDALYDEGGVSGYLKSKAYALKAVGQGAMDVLSAADPIGVMGLGSAITGTAKAVGAVDNVAAAAVKVVGGNSDEAAVVIGQGMGRVKSAAKKVGAETFSPSEKAVSQFSDLVEQAGGARLSDEVVEQTMLFKENKQWIQSMKDQGRKVIDIGPQSGRSSSTFYEMERHVIHGGD